MMLETYTDLKEKIVWLQMYIDQSYSIHKKTEEMLAITIRTPRNAGWNNSVITQLIENTEKQRKLVEELLTIYDVTVLNDMECLINKIDAKINQLDKEKQKFEMSLKGMKQNVDQKRLRYLNSLENNKIDTWFCAVEYKNLLRIYLKEKERNENDFRLRNELKDDEYCDYVSQYENIVANFVKIQQAHIEKLTDIYNVNFEPIFDPGRINCMGSDGGVLPELYDISATDDRQINFAKEYQDEIENVGNLEKDTNNSVIKYGIYKTKRSNQSSWHLSFVVYTQEEFLHIFELSTIIKNNKNLKIKYSNIINRITAQPIKKLLFFSSKIISQLNMAEETEFLEFTKAIYENYDFLCQEDIRYTVYLPKKTVRLNKESYEITIENKCIGSISYLFSQTSTRIKSFVLKDIYELHFGFNKKMPKNLQSVEKNLDVDLANTDAKIEETISNNGMWANIKENNPWEDG